MEWGVLAVFAVGWVFVAPAVALFSALSSADRLKRLELRLAGLEGRLFDPPLGAAPVMMMAPAPAASPPHFGAMPPGYAPAAAVPRWPDPPRVDPPAPAAAPAAVEAPAPPPVAPVALEAAPTAPPAAAAPEASAVAAGPVEPTFVPPPALRAPPPVVEVPAFRAPEPEVAADPAAGASLEEQFGVTWLTRAGAAAFLLGALFFFKYAVENDWIGPWGREALGAAVGALLLVAAEYIRKTAKPKFVHALSGIGLAVLFVTVWASVAAFELVPRPVAFVVNGALALAGAGLARRHKGPAILVLALVAAFLNPVLLSTGQDRAIELFAYLLVVTTAAEVVALELAFEPVGYLSMLGVGAIFIGWWTTHGHTYIASSAYAVPLVAIAAFLAAWSTFAVVATRKRGEIAGGGRVAVALLLATSALAVVLHREPLGFSVAMVALALVVSFVGHRMQSRYVGVPVLLVAAAGFAFVLGFAKDFDRAPVLTAVAAFALALGAGPLGFRARGAVSGPRAVMAAAPALLFAIVATASLASGSGATGSVVDRPLLAVALVLAAVVAYALYLAERASVPALAHVFVAATGAMMLLATAALPGGVSHASTLLAAGIWAAAAALPFFASSGRGPAAWHASVGPALGGIGFSIVAVTATGAGDDMVRAGALFGAALVEAAFAGYAFARRRQSDVALALAGLALALFAISGAYALTGASVTVLWAVLAAGAAFLAAHQQRPAFLGLAGALFLAVLTRALGVDVAHTVAASDEFVRTQGAAGVLAPAAFTNQGAVGVTACALALLVAAWIMWRPALTRLAAQLAAVVGYTLLVAVFAVEIRHLTESLPAPPRLATPAVWADFLSRLEAARAANLPASTMITTLVIAASSLALLGGGFTQKSAFHRYLGLVGLAVAFAKLVLWDVWHVERVHQVVLLTGVGALLGLGGFLYARFGRRIVAMMKG